MLGAAIHVVEEQGIASANQRPSSASREHDVRASQRHELTSIGVEQRGLGAGVERDQSRRIAQLSGGQQQRVALARALVNRPEVLLLDEPLGALDLKLRTDMQSQLKDLQRTVGVTFCYVTHDQGEAFSMSDRVAVMNQGLLEQVGTPEDIYHRPASAFVADFVGTANRFAGRIESGSAGEYAVAIDGIGRREVRGPDGLPAGSQVLVLVRPENLQLSEHSGDGKAGLLASVVDAAFLGAERTVRLHSPVLGELTAAARGAGPTPERGARVELSWSDDDAWLIPAAEPAS